MTDLLDQIREAEAMQTALELSEAEKEIKKSEYEATKKSASEMITTIRQRLLDGETTGDIALDIKISIERSLEKDTTYHNLAWLYESLVTHKGELILLAMPRSTLYQFGVIGEDLKIHLVFDGYLPSSNSSIDIYLPKLFANASEKLTDSSLIIQYSAVQNPNFAIYNQDGQGLIHIGNEAVQHWLDKQNTRTALEIWLKSRRLGIGLTASEAIFAEYIRSREYILIKITQKTDELRLLQERFKNFQTSPHTALLDRKERVESVKTNDGVSLKFPTVLAEIAKVTDELNKLLDRAVIELIMSDNEHIQTTSTLIGRENS